VRTSRRHSRGDLDSSDYVFGTLRLDEALHALAVLADFAPALVVSIYTSESYTAVGCSDGPRRCTEA
jgi:hypothetical protein